MVYQPSLFILIFWLNVEVNPCTSGRVRNGAKSNRDFVNYN
jgi:hypothetical protein